MWYKFILVISYLDNATRREQDIFDVLPAVKWCAPGRSFESFESMPREVLNEDFGGEHRGFIGDLQPHLQALVVEATELLELCIRAPYAKGEERRGMRCGGREIESFGKEKRLGTLDFRPGHVDFHGFSTISVRNNYIQESAIFVHRLQNFLVEAYRKKHLRLNADLADVPGILRVYGRHRV